MKIREEIYHYHANIIFLFKNINIDINKLLAYYTYNYLNIDFQFFLLFI